MKRSSLLLLLLTLAVVGCSTAAEVLSSNDSPFGYSKKNDGSGKYVRTRRVNTPRPQGYIDNLSPIYTGDEHHHYPISENNQNENVAGDVASSLVGLAISEGIKSTRSTSYRYEKSEPVQLGIGLSTAILEEGGVGQLGIDLERDFARNWVSGRLGLAMMNSDYTYLGGNLGIRVSNPRWQLSPYVGVEGYLGDHKSCTYESVGFDEIETCEKVFLASAYSELGLRLNIKDSMRLYVFTRGLSKINQTTREDLAMFYGFSLFFGNL